MLKLHIIYYLCYYKPIIIKYKQRKIIVFYECTLLNNRKNKFKVLK